MQSPLPQTYCRIFSIVGLIVVLILFVIAYLLDHQFDNYQFFQSKSFSHGGENETLLSINKTQQNECFELILKKLGLTAKIAKNMKPHFTELERPFDYTTLPSHCFLMLYDKQNDTDLHPNCFRRHFSDQFLRQRVRNSLKVIRDAFESANIELVLNSGSALGSWRFHGLVPYDHDIDFRFNVKFKPKVKQLLEELSQNFETHRMLYRDTESLNQHWVMYVACDFKKYSSCHFAFDFFFNWVSQKGVKMKEKPRFYPYKMLYPLVQRPFEGILFWTFNDMPRMIKLSYPGPANMCDSSHDWKADGCPNRKLPCNKLQFKYPYVKRTMMEFSKLNSSIKVVVEVLINKTHIDTVFITPNILM